MMEMRQEQESIVMERESKDIEREMEEICLQLHDVLTLEQSDDTLLHTENVEYLKVLVNDHTQIGIPAVTAIDELISIALRTALEREKQGPAFNIDAPPFEPTSALQTEVKQASQTPTPVDFEMFRCRSIYIHNIPQFSSDVSLLSIFEKFGTISKIQVIPVSYDGPKSAYVQFEDFQAANQAMKFSGRLVFDGVLLKFDKSLRYDLKSDVHETDDFKGDFGRIVYKPSISATASDGLGENNTRGLFAGNVPFDCEEGEFLKTFKKFGVIDAHELPFAKVTGRLHGFGFVLFKDPSSVKKCLQKNGKVEIRGRVLMLQPSPSFERKINKLMSQRSQHDE